jgi:uncharacterized repeat protein (TIGR04076 family)
MAVQYPPMGHKVVAKVLGMENPCTINMREGDEFELSIHKCGNFCGAYYHAIQPFVVMLQTGGELPGLPDQDLMQGFTCPNPQHKVQLELKRVRA